MRHGSLFSGIGGFDLAAEWMGWENVFHCEWNPFGQKVLKHYWPKAISYEDITKTDFSIHRGNIDIITGGFPCQPYSAAGKRLGKEDERHLWPEMLRAIREIKPRWVVGENVYGLVNWSGGLVFHEVQADLEAEGYEVQPYLFPAVSVNAPHRRDRIWFVAHSKSARTRSDIGGIRSVSERCNTWEEKDELAQNTNDNGRRSEQRKEESREWEQRNISAGNNEWVSTDIDEIRSSSNPNDSRADIGMPSEREWKESDSIGGLAQPELGQTGMDGDAANTMHVRLQQCEDGGEMGGGQSEVCGTGSESANGTQANGEVRDVTDICNEGLERSKNGGSIAGIREESHKFTSGRIRPDWSNFPTVSAVRFGNDGFSDRLDGITFPKWRNESIKAGGNAVVPQVVYQIFKTIEAYEKMGI